MEEEVQISSVQLLSCVQLFDTPQTAARQIPLSINNSRSMLKLVFINSVMPSNHLIFWHPLLLPLQPFPASGSFLMSWLFAITWPKYWSFSFSISPSNSQDWFPLRLTGWISLKSKGLSRVFSKTTVQKHQFFCAQLSLQSNSHVHTWLLEKHSLTIQAFVGKVMSLLFNMLSGWSWLFFQGASVF